MRICFDPFEVDVTNGRLLKFGVRVPLREQAFQLLLALLDRPGELVTRAELRERLWSDATTVDFEAGLNTAISRLRTALNDAPESPRFVETVPKRGYRFIATIPQQPSIAVMPLDSEADDSESEQIAETVTEELIRILGRLEGVRVASRSTVSRFKGRQYDPMLAAKTVRVAFLVEGSVRRVADNVRIHVHLVDGRDGFEIWAERYDGEWKSMLSVPDRVAEALSAVLERRLLPSSPHTRTPNVLAYSAYSKGHFLVARHSLAKALEYFEQAIQSDPNYALAYHGAAVAHILRALMGQRHPQEDMSAAESLLGDGLRLAPDLAFIQNTLGMLKMFQWRWDEAEIAYSKAIAAEPENAYAHMMFALHHSFRSQHVLALRHARTALELQPLDPMTNFRLVQCLYYARDYDGAVEAAASAIELAPGFASAHWYLGWALLEMGRAEEAWISASKARHLERDSPLCEAQAGYVAGRAGRDAEARAVHEDLESRRASGYCPSIAVAWVHLGLRDTNAALAWLGRALQDREPYLASALVFPGYDPLRSNGAFRTILDKVRGKHPSRPT